MLHGCAASASTWCFDSRSQPQAFYYAPVAGFNDGDQYAGNNGMARVGGICGCMHNLAAVITTAKHSSQGWHCGYDTPS